jgi:hypothetical protein
MLGPLFAYSFSAVLAVAAGFVLLWARKLLCLGPCRLDLIYAILCIYIYRKV